MLGRLKIGLSGEYGQSSESSAFFIVWFPYFSEIQSQRVIKKRKNFFNPRIKQDALKNHIC